MKLQGRNLSASMQGADVALLHRELSQLNFSIPAEETQKQMFGRGTQKAVVEFQRQHDLEPTGVVDEDTAKQINSAVDTGPTRELFIVRGQLRTPENTPISSAVVRAFDKGLRSAQPLGEATSDKKGNYEISYSPAKFRRAKQKTADLIVRVVSADGKQLAESEIVFNAATDAKVDIIVAPRLEKRLSEYEQLVAQLNPLLEDVEFAELTEKDIKFLSGETRIEGSRISQLSRAAQVAPEAKIPQAVFYGWFRQKLPTDLDHLLAVETEVLRRGLEQSITANIIPSRLSESLDSVLFQAAELKAARAARLEETFTQYSLVGRLLNQKTNAALGRFRVRGFDLDAGKQPKNLGYDITDFDGLFELSYAMSPNAPTAKGGRRLRLQISDREGVELHSTEIKVSLEMDVVDIRVSIPDPPETVSPTLAELNEKTGLHLPAKLLTDLAGKNIKTIADVLRNGSLRNVDGLQVQADDPAIKTLEAHARLSLLSSDVQLNAALIEQGYTSSSDVARAPRSSVVSSARGKVGDYRAYEMHVRAKAQQQVYTNAATNQKAEKANGYKGGEFEAGPSRPESFAQPCSCEDCEAAVSPLAYLADLLDYASENLQDNFAPVTLSFLQSTLHQRFGDLPVSCEEMNRQVRQVRICIEVLRSYLTANHIPVAPVQKQALKDAEKAYCLEAYTTLLTRLGTSFEEVRLARTAKPAQRQSLAERLGIDLGHDRPDFLDAFFFPPSVLNESVIEALFGLVDTTRDCLSEGVKFGDPDSEVTSWNLNGVEWNRNTDPNGGVFLRLTKPAANVFRVQVFNARTQGKLVASGERDSAQGVILLEEENNSGLSGQVSIAYSGDAEGIQLVVVPRILSWRLAHLRTLWSAQDFPDDAYSAGLSFAELKELPAGLEFPLGLAKRIRYSEDEQLLIFTGVMTSNIHDQLLNLSTSRVYREAVDHLFEESQRPPFIDPDLIGPDDFREPIARITVGGQITAFEIWLRRRAWVDENLDQLRQAREANGLAQILESVFGDPLPDFAALQMDLTANNENDKQRAEADLKSLDLTAAGLARLIEISEKDQQATNDPTNEAVLPEEWEDVYAILVQSRKIKRFPAWRNEELIADVILGPEKFWISLREPVEGPWPPRNLATPPKPFIDPDEIKLTDLPEPTAGRIAITIWQARLLRLELIKRNLKQRLDQARLDEDPDPIMTLMRQALGDPNPGDTLPLPDAALPDILELESLYTTLTSADQALVNAATTTVEQNLHMSADEFKRLLAVKLKVDAAGEPAADEWVDVTAILARAQKVKRLYPAWLIEEQTAGLNENYWLLRKAALPGWRASAEARSAWQQALRGRSRAPIIDPNLINPGDIRNPMPGDPALELWTARKNWVRNGLAALKAERESEPDPLAAFDSIVVSTLTLTGGARLDGLISTRSLQKLSAELETAREANGLNYVLAQTWGTPIPKLLLLQKDLSSNSNSVRTNARTTITGTLFITIADFELLMQVKQKDDDGEAITNSEWRRVNRLLAEATLLKSVFSLDDALSGAEDKDRRLDQLNLPLDAFNRLAQVRKILVSKTQVLDAEWDEVYAILMQVQKRRSFATWRLEEDSEKLLHGPDDFKIPPPLPLRFPPVEPAPLLEWLATIVDRQDWQDTLQARIDQQQAVHSALLDAVSATEEIALPKLRDALVWASNSQTSLLAVRAKWIGDRLLIDAQNSGCQLTTRVAQAIETIQGLLFSVRTRILNDTYPNLVLISDDFDEEWEWIGSYATWRTAVFVFLYPENILLPSLRTWQTPAFRKLITDLRSNRRMTPEYAREAAATYAEYFHDIATLKVQASCQTLTHVVNRDGEEAGDHYLMHMFARGGATRTIYWSHHGPGTPIGYAQSFWEAVPGTENFLGLIGAVPFQISDEERFIYVFARAREKGTQKLVFITYDLVLRTWNTEQTELELPEKAIEFAAVTMQHSRETNPPTLAIRMPGGAIYVRQLNADGTDWNDGDWVPLIGRKRGETFTKLCGMVEFATDAYCLIVSSDSNDISYFLSGSWNDGYWRYLATGKYLGALFLPNTTEIQVFWWSASGTGQRAIRPIGNLPVKAEIVADEVFDSSLGLDDWLNDRSSDSMENFNDWLGEVAGLTLRGITVPQGMPYGGLDFYSFLTLHNKDLILSYLDTLLLSKSEERGVVPDNSSQWAAILDMLSLSNWIGGMPGLLKLFQVAAINWLSGKIKDTSDYLDPHFGHWKLAAEATKFFFEAEFSTVLKRAAGLKDGSAKAPRRLNEELSDWFWAMQDLKRIAPTSGYISNENHRQYAVQFDQPYRTRFSREQAGELSEVTYFRESIAPKVTGLFEISEGQSESQLQFRRNTINQIFLNNEEGPRTNLVYLEEAYYFVPIHLALQLQARGHYVAALDWYRSVYDYSRQPQLRKIYYGLEKEESFEAGFERAEDWLLDPLNPHEIAATRRNTYTRFTLLSIVRCLLEFADAEFTLDTAESVPRARLLYLTALELLDAPELKQHLDSCANIIGTLSIDAGDADWRSNWDGFNRSLTGFSDTEGLTNLVEQVKEIQSSGASAEDQFAAANALLKRERGGVTPRRLLGDTVERKALITTEVHTALSSHPQIAAAGRRAADMAAANLVDAVSRVTGIQADALDQASLPWLSQPMTMVQPEAGDATRPSDTREESRMLVRSNRRDRTQVQILETFATSWPMTAVQVMRGSYATFVPLPHYEFCIPPNPVVRALRLRAELNLYKIRTCRNIAGMKRQIEPYAAPTDTFSGMPMIGDGGQLVLPGLAILKPTPYRYPVLIERAKQLVGLAQQIEAAFLATLEKADAERYSILKARQDVQLATAGVRLQTLRVSEAQGGVKLAELQQERAQIQVNQYQEWLDAGWNTWEALAVLFMGGAAEFHAIGAVAHFTNVFDSDSQASGLSELGASFSALASMSSTLASYERREQEWEFQKALAEQDVIIGAQQVKIAEDHVRVVEQERMISEMQADQAKQVVDFLSTKFTNVELYDWMSSILEGVYSFFLQEATAMAQLATNQLAFERQEVPPPYVQGDYWEAPGDGFGSSDGKALDRRGLTGSARLLQDIHQLDQYAFNTNQRKLQLTKTISLAQMSPAEFQRFRETGVMRFDTPMEMFDRDFPGHYLRLIRQVRTSTIALIPPAQGIRATLSTTGTSRVVIGGDIFQTTIVNHGPQSIALSAPRDATGLFELEPQGEMLLPFEGLGVATGWEFRMPKAANLFDYRTIADVLLTIEYTALNSFDYYQQVIQTLKPNLSADRPFSFRHQFADQWYDFHNPDQTATPMTVRFKTFRDDFPPNLERLKIGQVALYFARRDGELFEVPVSHLHFVEPTDGGSVGGGSISIDGLISTLKGNAGSWTSMIGKAPIGDWELALPDTDEIRNRFKHQEIEDILLIITYAGRTPEWPS